mgnify:CR=1 FL=1
MDDRCYPLVYAVMRGCVWCATEKSGCAEENDAHLREQLSFITEAQKELLYAVHAEGHVQSITSSAFNKKHRLRSPSSTQSAALKLLEYDMITRKEKVYSLSDPLLSLWLDRR